MYRLLKKLWWMLGLRCRYCGSDDTNWNETPESERPHWRIFCKKCGKRRHDLDGYSE